MNRIVVKAVALIIGLPLFLWACEKDLGERGSGKKVTINFTVGNEGYGADQQILKGSGVKEAKPETVYIPLDNNYFMAATLTPEPEEEVRATAEFETGQKIYFAVYSGGGTTPDDEAIYEWNGSKFVPDGDPLGVEADGTNYHFVAYSFFGDPTEEPYVDDIEPFQDFVWGEKDQPVYDNETSRTVPILMRHKFSRVRVRVDASTISDAEITDIDNVVIAGGKEVTMVTKTGAVDSYGADVTATLENWVSENNDKAMLSDYAVFCPSLTTITVGTLDLEIDGDPLPLTNKSVTFSQTLAENTSYTVVVDVRANRWAWSNIYWDATLNDGDGAMTFDRTLVDLSHQYYQGIFFKWGSLVGSSYTGHLYIPDNVVTKTWVGPKDISETSWTIFNDIPYNGDYASMTGSYLYYHPNYSSYLGDICNYIDEDWRMPSIVEMTATTPEMEARAMEYSEVGGSVVSINADGTGVITAGGRYNGSSGFAFFPASGYINGYNNSTSSYPAGSMMLYHTGSPSTEVNATYCRWGITRPIFNSQYYNVFTITNFIPRRQMYPVRCIRKLPTD